MPPLEESNPSYGYWRSLAELSGEPEVAESERLEFPHGIPGDFDGVSRRRFMQLMGASVALAGAAGCRYQKTELLPEVARPQGVVPGVPRYYATSYELSGVSSPLLVTSYDGRPIKVDGNPDHPASQSVAGPRPQGASSLFAQASVLDMYDPDRSQRPAQFEGGKLVESDLESFKQAIDPIFAKLRTARGKGLHVLAEATSSPSMLALRAKWQEAYPDSVWHEYEPLSSDHERAGLLLAFGKPYRPVLALAKAKVVVTLDADLFGAHPNSVQYTRDFYRGRDLQDARGRDADSVKGPLADGAATRPTERMNRLYAIESNFTVTGAAADHRLPYRSSEISALLLALAGEVLGQAGLQGAQDSVLQSLTGSNDLVKDADAAKFVHVLAKDLVAHRGQAVIAVGPNQPAEVHAIAHRLNVVLGAAGETVTYAVPADGRPADNTFVSHLADISQVTEAIIAGQNQIETLVILGGNPVYDAPADLKFGEALASLRDRGLVIHLASHRNETSRQSNWHVARSHYLESWGDSRSFDGTINLAQPLILPLYQTKSALELVGMLLGEADFSAEALVKATTLAGLGNASNDGKDWEKALHDGFVKESAYASETPTAASFQYTSPPVDAKATEVVFVASSQVYDGRFANNGWLQEVPDFMTKLTWDNAAFVGPQTAKDLNLRHEGKVKLTVDGLPPLEMGVFIQPGIARGSIILPLGYGRTAAGHVGGDSATDAATVGFNTYGLRTTTAAYVRTDVKVEKVGGSYRFSTTQDHHAIDKVGIEAIAGRVGNLIRESTAVGYEKNPDFVEAHEHTPHQESIFEEWKYDGHRWGLAIDLNKCAGCNACIVACQSENNIPVVGKDQVRRHREMHWLRIDRYFAGDIHNPRVAHQPMPCQQCENAPCEQVCPVAATVHSHEGLNDMAYNRCVGTRYCSNNCPYKVRRFNFFNYQYGPLVEGMKDPPVYDLAKPENEVLRMARNPEVTVRSRGVMEKCTFCVQRIQNAKINARVAKRPIADGEIVPACAQACPSQAIVFGDLANEQSLVANLHKSKRAYSLLTELLTKPRVAYLARITNPHPELAGEDEAGGDHGHHA